MKELNLKDLRELQALVTDKELLIQIEWHILTGLMSEEIIIFN